MNILVINIPLRPNPSRIYLPIGLGYVVSSIKRAGFEFDLLDLDAHPNTDEQIQKFLHNNHYDVVVMGCIVTGYKHVKWLSQIIKDAFNDTIIVVGNTVAQSIPNILLTKTKADIAVMGEGEETIVELLKRLQTSRKFDGIRGIWYRLNGEIISGPNRPVIENIDSIPSPCWDIFDVELYIESLSKSIDEPSPPIPREQIRAIPINTARGCLYNCTFCYHAFRGERYRWRSSESIIREMRYLYEKYGINFFAFNDELTFFSINQAESFADALYSSGLQVYWMADCRSGLFVRDEHTKVASKLKKAGCMSLSFSLESADPDILTWMNKKTNPIAFSRQVEILRRAELASLTSIVIGFPSETKETIKATFDCCISNGLFPSTGYLLPQPGTPMYEYAREHGYIWDEEAYLLAMGDRQDLRLNMTRMPNDELEEVVKCELSRCNHELGLNLQNDALLKTGFYRSPKHEKR